MADLINSQLPDADAASMIEQLKAMTTLFEPHYHNLSNDERTGIRTMAEGREGIVRTISQIAIANPDDLSKKDDPAHLTKKLDYDVQLESIRQLTVKFLEYVEETQLANSQDIMGVADAFAASLQIARTRNSALDEALKPVDEHNKKFGRSQKKEELPPANPVLPIG